MTIYSRRRFLRRNSVKLNNVRWSKSLHFEIFNILSTCVANTDRYTPCQLIDKSIQFTAKGILTDKGKDCF
jgi:hypothetical protein